LWALRNMLSSQLRLRLETRMKNYDIRCVFWKKGTKAKMGRSPADQPVPTWSWCLLALWQIPPIRPVLPVYKCFTVNNLRLERYLHTVEVVGFESCCAHHKLCAHHKINNLEDCIAVT